MRPSGVSVTDCKMVFDRRSRRCSHPFQQSFCPGVGGSTFQKPVLSFSTFTLKQDLTPLYTQVYKTMIYKTMSFIPLFRNFRLLSLLLPSRGRTENGPKKGEKTDRAASCAHEKASLVSRGGRGVRGQNGQPERTQPLLAAKVCRAAASPSTVHLRP